MKTNKFTGWNDVFSFTFLQAIKSKTYQISLLILIILSLVSMPIINLVSGDKNENQVSPIQKIYVDNQLGIDFTDLREIKTIDRFKHIEIVPMADNYDTTSSKIEQDETASIILTMIMTEGVFSFQFVKSSDGPVSSSNLEQLGEEITTLYNNFRVSQSGATEEQKHIISSNVTTQVSFNDINGTPIVKEDTSISEVEYILLFGVVLFLFMVNLMAGSNVATSIATEKSTRVIEYLLTSIEPLALVVGKVLAMLLATLIQMFSLIISFILSNTITTQVTGSDTSYISKLLPIEIIQNLNPLNIILSLIIFILGMIFYATLASLAGATVSRLDELSEGLALFSITNVVGVYITLGSTLALMSSGVNGYVVFSFLFPLSSPFSLPGAILIGKASLLYGGIAIVLLLITIYFLFVFVAKIYETLILHNGNTVKTKDLIKMFRSI